MLIGNTIIGLQRLMQIMHFAEKQKQREESENRNIYELILSPANKERVQEEEVRVANIINLREFLEENEEKHITWMMTNAIINQANNNIAQQNAEQERASFAEREANRAIRKNVAGIAQ